MLEGVPLVFLATIYIYLLTDLCRFVTCDAAAIKHAFPSSVLTLPSAPPISEAQVLAIHSHDHHCSHLPLTSDGWFTFDRDILNTTFVDRKAAPLERVVEFEVTGECSIV